MRVFITGASGWVGTAVTRELLSAGHHVVGLARSDASAKALQDAGVEVHRGSLEDLDSLKAGAKAADGIIHCAFIHDFSSMDAITNACNQEDLAVEALCSAIEGTTKPLIVTHGTGGLAVVDGQPATEDSPRAPFPFPRGTSEAKALAMASKGIHISVVRLPPTTHGVGESHGFMCRMVAAARTNGFAGYINDGLNQWPAVNVVDAAKLFKLALEKSAIGGLYHAVQDTGVSIKDIATVIGRHLDLPTKSMTMEEGQASFGGIAMIIALNTPASSFKTQKELGWKPSGPTLMEDLEGGWYYGQ